MVSILKDNSWDTPQKEDKIYFSDVDTARKTGIELLKEFNCQVFKIIRLTTGIGHYKTIGYFNANNEYIR